MAAQYVMIETGDPFNSGEATAMRGLAGHLADNSAVTVYLAENGVFAVRKGSTLAPAVEALANRVTVWADDFSLRERGIGDVELAAGVERSGLDPLVDLIVQPGCRVLWH